MDFCKLVNAEFNSAVTPVKLSRTKGNIQTKRSEDSFPDLLWGLKRTRAAMCERLLMCPCTLMNSEMIWQPSMMSQLCQVLGTQWQVHTSLHLKDEILFWWLEAQVLVSWPHTCLTLVKVRSQKSVCMSFCLCCLYQSKATMRRETHKFQTHCFCR